MAKLFLNNNKSFSHLFFFTSSLLFHTLLFFKQIFLNMSFIQETPYTWSDSTAFDKPRHKSSPYTPLEKMSSTSIPNNTAPTLASQLQRIMIVDDDEIFDGDEAEDFTYLPPTNTTTNLAGHDSVSSDFSHIQYVNTVRKTRPLPKIPERSASKELPKNMTEVFNDNFKSQNKLTAQQLFEMLSHNRISAMENEEQQDEQDNDDNEEYGGVYALKTQIPSPNISNSTLNHLSYQYENFNTNYYKMMTPVQEVEEDQLYTAEYEEEEDLSPTYVLEPVDHTTPGRSSSEASLNTPSLASGRTSPYSNSSRHSMESGNQKENCQSNAEYELYYNQDEAHGIQQQQETEEFKTQHFYEKEEYQHQHDANSGINSSDVADYNCIQESQQSSEIYQGYSHPPETQLTTDQVEGTSLISDVKRLAELNQALMTPVIPNKHFDSTQTTLQNPEVVETTSPDDYSNINTNSPLAMTSFSLTHDKESIKTYRRMAIKTNDKNIQFTYAKYLLQLVSFHGVDREKNITRDRLQEEAEYWIEKLAKSNHAEALYIKGQWHGHCCDKNAIGVFVGSQYRKVNQAKAFKCFQQAARLGSSESYYELAEYWKCRKDYKKALSNYRYAASKNHILSLYVTNLQKTKI